MSLANASIRCCCAAMPAAAEYMPSSKGSPGSPASARWRSSRSRFLVSRGSRRARVVVERPGRLTEALLDRAEAGRGLVERLVDGLDDLLAGFEGAQRGDHVDHRARRVDARA